MPRKTSAVLQGQMELPGAQKGSQRASETQEKPPKEPQGAVIGSTRDEANKSWAAVGIDTSMTAVSGVATGFDAKMNRIVAPVFAEMRWMPETDYYVRLGEAARSHDLVLSLLRKLWVVDPSRVFIAVEEPIFYGAIKGNMGSFIKQQCEIAGSVKGALVRYGFLNISEINNSQWKKTLRTDGVEFETVPRGTPAAEKTRIAWRNKMAVKTWAMSAWGLPDLPDLVKSKSGAKIPRPESGYGAKAQAVQPNDIYDAAAVCAWMVDYLEQTGVVSL